MKAVRLRLSVDQIELLDPLARRIRDTWDSANSKATTARTAGNEAVKEALLCGQALLEAKAIAGHGQWMVWLRRHCEDVAKSEDTAHRWMKLAKANSAGLRILEASSLAGAYRMVGILPELAGPEGQATEEPGEDQTLERVRERVQWFQRLGSKVSTWPEEMKRKVADDLRPLIELYQQLIPEAKSA